MSVSYLVFYRGEAENHEAFVRRYREKHLPLLKGFPGIERIVLLTPIDLSDAYKVSPGQFSLIVQMEFASIKELEVALRSPMRGRAREDFGRFPPFYGDVWHQAMELESILEPS